MISASHKFIFLHIPKTGGNSIQSALLPFSDDEKSVSGQQDGVDRFEIRGAVTPRKHATLQEYADVLGEGLSSYRTIAVFRDPLDRALSMYYSPHRVLSAARGQADFDPAEFDAVIAKMKTAASFVTVDGQTKRPDFVIRFDHLGADFAKAADGLGLPALQLDLLNASSDVDGERTRLRSDPEVIARVRRKFAEDYALHETLGLS